MNCVELMGRLTKDPAKGNGNAFFTIALDRQGAEGADYPDIVVFGKQAETVLKYLHKGSQVCIQGRISTGKYEKNGNTVYYTNVVATRVEFVGGGTKKETVKQEPVEDVFESLDEDAPF